jgi:hypothetical protein
MKSTCVAPATRETCRMSFQNAEAVLRLPAESDDRRAGADSNADADADAGEPRARAAVEGRRMRCPSHRVSAVGWET